MNNPNDPAFPFPTFQRHDCDIECGFHGLTKREYFAAMAMQGLCANSHEAIGVAPSDKIAKWSVKQADALIAALAKETT